MKTKKKLSLWQDLKIYVKKKQVSKQMRPKKIPKIIGLCKIQT